MYRGIVVEPDLRGGYPVRGGEGVVSGEGCPSIAPVKESNKLVNTITLLTQGTNEVI